MRVDNCERNMYCDRNTQHGRKSTAANAGLSAHKRQTNHEHECGSSTNTQSGISITTSKSVSYDATKSLDAPDHQKSTAEAANSWAASLHAVRGGPMNEAREVHLGKTEFEQLRRSLLAASYSQHGADLGSLFAHYDRNHDGTLSPEELHGVLQKSLPGVLSDKQLRCIIDLMDRDHNGRVDFTEFASFIASQNKPCIKMPHTLRNYPHQSPANKERYSDSGTGADSDADVDADVDASTDTDFEADDHQYQTDRPADHARHQTLLRAARVHPRNHADHDY